MTWRVLTSNRALQAAGLLGVLLVVALWPESIEVQLGRVSRGAFAVKIEATGETRVHHRFTVESPIAGRLEPSDLQPGHGVVQGVTIVARITAAAAESLNPAARKEATAALDTARREFADAQQGEKQALATLDDALTELKLAQASYDAGETTRQSVNARQNLVGSAEEAVSVSRFALAEAAARVERARIRLLPARQRPQGQVLEVVAPVEGVVLQRLQPDGSSVAPGAPILEIGDPSHVRIIATLPAKEAARLEPGMRVEVERWGGETPLTAWVERVEPPDAGDQAGAGGDPHGTAVIDFEDDRAAWRAMGEGFGVQVRIAVWQSEDSLHVPNDALFQVGERWAAYVVQNGRARLTFVQRGARNEEETEVRSGLSAGQEVVIQPPDTLTDNARVFVREPA